MTAETTETTEPLHEEGPWWKETYEIPVWQWIGVLTTIVLTVFGGIIGFAKYLDDRDRQYEGDQVSQCETIIISRENTKGALADVYDYLDGRSGAPSDDTIALRARLDARFPVQTVPECIKERFG